MNARIVAKILRRAAREIFTFDMTEDEWRDYHKKHPGAKRWNHHIVPNSDKKKYKNKDLRRQQLIKKMKIKKDYFNKMKEIHPNYEPIIKKEDLNDLLYHGEYSCISAGVNPNDPEDVHKAKSDPNFIKRRTERLRNDLDRLGVKYTEIVGKYGQEEPSFLISHTLEAKASEEQPSDTFLVGGNVYTNDDHIIEKLNKLGEQYKQDSVGHVKNGKMELHYTTGPNKGKRRFGKNTTPLQKDEDEDYSEGRIGDRDYTKWTCNIDWNNLYDNPYMK